MRSRLASLAILRASSVVMTPRFSPSFPMTRSSRARICALMRVVSLRGYGLLFGGLISPYFTRVFGFGNRRRHASEEKVENTTCLARSGYILWVGMFSKGEHVLFQSHREQKICSACYGTGRVTCPKCKGKDGGCRVCGNSRYGEAKCWCRW